MTDPEVIQSSYEDDLRKLYAVFAENYTLAKMERLWVEGKNIPVNQVLASFCNGLVLAREIRDVLLKEVSDVR